MLSAQTRLLFIRIGTAVSAALFTSLLFLAFISLNLVVPTALASVYYHFTRGCTLLFGFYLTLWIIWQEVSAHSAYLLAIKPQNAGNYLVWTTTSDALRSVSDSLANAVQTASLFSSLLVLQSHICGELGLNALVSYYASCSFIAYGEYVELETSFVDGVSSRAVTCTGTLAYDT